MMVTTAITNRVTPMAITVPNLTESQSMLQWLRLHTSATGGMGSIPSQGTKIPHAARGQKKEPK